MRNVIYSMFVSLDGFIEGPDRALDWHIVDEELHTFVNDREREIGTYLYGRRMYEVMAYWETADADLSNPKYALEYARMWQRTPKIVFSHTLEHVPGNARLVRELRADQITRLKEQLGKDMVVGGASIAASFAQLGLIDEYGLYIHPVVLGGGTPMFGAMDHRTNLRLIETHTFSSGVVFLRYRPDRGAPDDRKEARDLEPDWQWKNR